MQIVGRGPASGRGAVIGAVQPVAADVVIDFGRHEVRERQPCTRACANGGGRDVGCRRSAGRRGSCAARQDPGGRAARLAGQHPRRQVRQAGRERGGRVPGPGAHDEMREVEHRRVVAPRGNFCKRISAVSGRKSATARGPSAVQRRSVSAVYEVPGRLSSRSLRERAARRAAAASAVMASRWTGDADGLRPAVRRHAQRQQQRPRRGRARGAAAARPRGGRRGWDRTCRRARPCGPACHVGLRRGRLQVGPDGLRAARRAPCPTAAEIRQTGMPSALQVRLETFDVGGVGDHIHLVGDGHLRLARRTRGGRARARAGSCRRRPPGRARAGRTRR